MSKPTAESRKLLSYPEAADAYGLNQYTIRRAVYKKELAVIRVNERVVRIRISDLEAWLKARTTPVVS